MYYGYKGSKHEMPTKLSTHWNVEARYHIGDQHIKLKMGCGMEEVGHPFHSTMSGWWSCQQLHHKIKRQELQVCWRVEAVHKTPRTFILLHMNNTLNHPTHKVWEILQHHNQTDMAMDTDKEQHNCRRDKAWTIKITRYTNPWFAKCKKRTTWDLFTTLANMWCKLFNSKHPQLEA